MKKVFMYMLMNHGFDTLSITLSVAEDINPYELIGSAILSQSLKAQTGYIVADTIESLEKECDKIVLAWRQAMYN